MALVAITAGAANLHSDHAVAAVVQFTDVLRIEGFVKAGPAGAGFELGAGGKESPVAQFALVLPVFLVVQLAAADVPLRFPL